MNDTANHTATTCTVVVNAEGGRCGDPAVVSFTGRGGEAFGECSAHAVRPNTAAEHYVGEVVTVQAYGKTYSAVVARVTRTGAAYAEFFTAKGTHKCVRI